MGVSFRQKGDFSKLTRYMMKLDKAVNDIDLDKYGRMGVEALSANTPVDTGLTARSWYYKIHKSSVAITLTFYNSNIQNGVPIAIILHYGHGTRNGGWVEGIDYINTALRPIFNKIAEDAWREVTKL